jgi:hypothetical protein
MKTALLCENNQWITGAGACCGRLRDTGPIRRSNEPAFLSRQAAIRRPRRRFNLSMAGMDTQEGQAKPSRLSSGEGSCLRQWLQSATEAAAERC